MLKFLNSLAILAWNTPFYATTLHIKIAAVVKLFLRFFLSFASSCSKPPPPRKKSKPPVASRPRNLAKVLYDYDAQDTDELQLKEGDVLEILVKGLWVWHSILLLQYFVTSSRSNAAKPMCNIEEMTEDCVMLERDCDIEGWCLMIVLN